MGDRGSRDGDSDDTARDRAVTVTSQGGGSGGPPQIASSSVVLGGNVVGGIWDAYVEVFNLSLVPGTWLVTASLTLLIGVSAQFGVVRLIETTGNTVYGSGGYEGAATAQLQCIAQGRIVLAATTVVRAQLTTHGVAATTALASTEFPSVIGASSMIAVQVQ